MKPDYDLIRRLEHECEVGLPHGEDCLLCFPSTATPVPTNLRYPSQEEWTRMVDARFTYEAR